MRTSTISTGCALTWLKLACGRLTDGIDLCSQPICSRLEDLRDLKTIIRLGNVVVG